MATPRGIRNNNPGNIRHGAKWDGFAEVQADHAFCTFISPEYGIRAMGKILLTYQRKYGIDTVAGIIGRWAPPNENDTGAYAAYVAKRIGVDPDDNISVFSNLQGLVLAIIQYENGQQPYDLSTIQRGVEMAQGKA
ncbi:structural protein [Maridesulfovibrio sp.]|uniref:structural protein n=1 Tax=Maridesulfovibrio sp. TaxID=2795000 RepID=UPI0029CA8F0D|nr:structural protein [Maridesulfovibrio sp.]